MRGAAHIVNISVINNRVVPTPLEPRVSVASSNDAKITLYNPSQGAVAQQGVLSRSIFHVEPEDIRVISGDTGGGFGVRGEVHPETVVCLYAARELQRPVKWCGDRSEMFLADSHGRDNISTATVALQYGIGPLPDNAVIPPPPRRRPVPTVEIRYPPPQSATWRRQTAKGRNRVGEAFRESK